MKKIFINILSTLMFINYGISQLQQPAQNFTANAGGTVSAERIARFKVSDAPNDVFEILSTSDGVGRFTPAIWAHKQSSNNQILEIKASTSYANDDNATPMILINAHKNSLATNSSSTFPWRGTQPPVALTQRAIFAIENLNVRLFHISANGNTGIGTSTPTARLHTVGNVRLEGLPSSTITTNVLTTDAQGNVFLRPISSLGSGGNTCLSSNFILKSNGANSTCSQIFDNGINVGIGTSSPTNKLTVNGNIQSITNTFLSDLKYKKNVVGINNALETINQLNPVTYNWKKEEYKEIEFDEKEHSGFIAQEIEKVLPNVVHTNQIEKSVNYTEIIPYLTAAIQELNKKVEQLYTEINNLKNNQNSIGEVTQPEELDDEIIISPNPTYGNLQITFNKERFEESSFILFDYNGNILKTFKLNKNKNQSIDISNIKNGVLLYKIVNKNGVKEGKIIKK